MSEKTMITLAIFLASDIVFGLIFYWIGFSNGKNSGLEVGRERARDLIKYLKD